MSTPSKFNQVKAAMEAVFSFNGKSLEDVENDLNKLASDEKKDKSVISKMFPFAALGGTLFNTGVNIGARGAQFGGESLAKLDSKMTNDDKDISDMRKRTQILNTALEELKRKHPGVV